MGEQMDRGRAPGKSPHASPIRGRKREKSAELEGAGEFFQTTFLCLDKKMRAKVTWWSGKGTEPDSGSPRCSGSAKTQKKKALLIGDAVRAAVPAAPFPTPTSWVTSTLRLSTLPSAWSSVPLFSHDCNIVL